MGDEQREMTEQEARVWGWMREWFPYLPESIVHQDLQTLWLHLAIIVMSVDKHEQSYK